MYVIEKSAVIGDKVPPHRISSDADKDCVKSVEIAGAEFLSV